MHWTKKSSILYNKDMKKLYIIYKTLEEAYGPYRGWPADSPLEMMISSILVQNTNWNNVLTSLDNLKPHLHRLKTMDTLELEGLIRPSGFMKGKAQCIKDLLILLDKGTPTRSDLLTIKGIGPETADCIMLYAFDQNYFVVDTYLKRLLSKAGFPNLKNYQSIQNFMHRNLPNSLDLYKAFHLYILESGKDKHILLENLYFSYEDEDLNTLKEAHPIMKKLIDSRVEFKRPIYETPLHALIGAIIGQVISAKLSKEIYNNFMKDFPDPLEALNHDLEGFKLSRSKIDTIHRILD